MYIPPFLSTE
ncbi:hypothetical protein RDI58_034720 [Solanum bulbocastanum]|uniref:Uncharacterized protein n=1 Tax=Solanum bulbocastanum TaxID=147425 RepID=A0AAN8SH60_SOLBU